MTKAEQKRRERLLILRTMLREDDGGHGLPGVLIADEAKLNRRGIGQKLASMALDGLVEGHQPPARRRETRGRWGVTHYSPPPMLWAVTDKGRVLAGEGNGDA